MIEINQLSYAYKNRKALDRINFSVAAKEIFGLLGPNGSGKTTLLRILSTLLDPGPGTVKIWGDDLSIRKRTVREKIGVVFQSPSLDLKLTVYENLYYHGPFFGLYGKALKQSCGEAIDRFGLRGREKELCERLSGGLKRRVELAKGTLCRPRLLLLDEPSSGLDPGARLELWKYLKMLQDENQMTIVVATHLMDEAEHCTRLAVMSEGTVVALGAPDALKREIGGDILIVESGDSRELAHQIETKFGIKPIVADGTLQIEHENGHRFMPELVESFPGKIKTITFRRPSLEDVFIHKTGHRFWQEELRAGGKP